MEKPKVGQYWYEDPQHIWYIKRILNSDLFGGIKFECINQFNKVSVNLYESSIMKFCKRVKYYNSPLWKVLNQ